MKLIIKITLFTCIVITQIFSNRLIQIYPETPKEKRLKEACKNGYNDSCEELYNLNEFSSQKPELERTVVDYMTHECQKGNGVKCAKLGYHYLGLDNKKSMIYFDLGCKKGKNANSCYNSGDWFYMKYKDYDNALLAFRIGCQMYIDKYKKMEEDYYSNGDANSESIKNYNSLEIDKSKTCCEKVEYLDKPMLPKEEEHNAIAN